jgi:hypothetical protein
VPVVLTLLLLAWATAYHLPCEHDSTGGEAVGWPRWRGQLLEQTREPVLVLVQGDGGILQLVEDSRLGWQAQRCAAGPRHMPGHPGHV